MPCSGRLSHIPRPRLWWPLSALSSDATAHARRDAHTGVHFILINDRPFMRVFVSHLGPRHCIFISHFLSFQLLSASPFHPLSAIFRHALLCPCTFFLPLFYVCLVSRFSSLFLDISRLPPPPPPSDLGRLQRLRSEPDRYFYCGASPQRLFLNG